MHLAYKTNFRGDSYKSCTDIRRRLAEIIDLAATIGWAGMFRSFPFVMNESDKSDLPLRSSYVKRLFQEMSAPNIPNISDLMLNWTKQPNAPDTIQTNKTLKV